MRLILSLIHDIYVVLDGTQFHYADAPEESDSSLLIAAALDVSPYSF